MKSNKNRILAFAMTVVLILTLSLNAFAASYSTLAQQICALTQISNATYDFLDEYPAGELYQDAVFEDCRIISVAYNDVSYATVILNTDGNVSFGYVDNQRCLYEYYNGVLTTIMPLSDPVTVTYELKEEYADDVQKLLQDRTANHALDDKILGYEQDGQIILSDDCYTITVTNGDNQPLAAAGVTNVYPAGEITSTYPVINGNIAATANKYDSRIGQNVAAKVKYVRNNYVLNKNRWSQIEAGRTLLEAAAQLFVSEGLLKTILNAYNLLTASNSIVSAFRFPDRVEYRVWEERNGWVFDKTVYNKYVKVYYNEGFSIISQAWATDDYGHRYNFVWDFTSDGPNKDISDAQILSNAHNLYCNNVASEGYCSLYTETE